MGTHWTARREGFRDPSPWVQRWSASVLPQAPVLDLACGSGRHGRLFLDRGHPVTFVDKDISGVADLADQAELIEVDLETGGPWPLGTRRFAAVVVTCYLHRPILEHIVAAVAPGGLLIYETFARGNEACGHPARPEYLLEEGELLEAVRGRLTVLGYEHGYDDEPKPGVRQRIAAQRSQP
ncbi:MAG: class I SAM-dependent methyltransferase [Gammaproteobacteria bacterium]|nr:MAG: class I SAM-dependent methyltransferase [Gammaproteobacteria bacterium]